MDGSEILNLLNEIKQNQMTAQQKQNEFIEYIKTQEEKRQKLVEESMQLQKQAVKRQRIIINIVLPIIIVGGGWIFYMVVKYL